MPHHLAQVNVARAIAPLDSPVMAGFVEGLAAVNAAADQAPGFVWRLQDEAGDATGIPFLDDPSLVLNLTVWTDLAALEDYVFSEPHRAFLQRRRQWFEPLGRPSTACWWVPAGHRPDVAEAEHMITRLWEQGSDDVVFAMGAGAAPPPPSPAHTRPGGGGTAHGAR